MVTRSRAQTRVTRVKGSKLNILRVPCLGI